MKKIVFLIIASLLVIGLVLPGCDGNGAWVRPRPVVAGEITIGVAGPMDDIQGEHHLAGAEMAVAEIGTVMVGATNYTLKLKEINTNEVHGPPGDGYSALLADIRNVDFVVGGFRTEAVYSYREVAMDSKVLFFNCGAATESLQHSVVDDYTRYQYWFKATPYNETFLVMSLLKMVATAAKGLRDGLVGYNDYVNADYKIGTGPDYTLRIAIVAESLSWAHGIVATAAMMLPTLLVDSQNITFEVVGIWRPSSTATTLATDFTTIAAKKPHIVFTAFSGPVGVAYSKERPSLLPHAVTIGINVEGQSKNQWTATSGGCAYDMMLDTWAEDVDITTLTEDFFTGFVAEYLDYPTYCAATYDAIFSLKRALETTDSLDPAVLIPWLENPANAAEGTGAKKTAYYPAGATTVGDDTALSEAQVLAIYPHLQDLKDWGAWTYNVTQWLVGPHTRHDTVYGSEYQTGLGVIWEPGGTKVGWWPAHAAGFPWGLYGVSGVLAYIESLPEAYRGPAAEAFIDAGVLDNYGYWLWRYPGAVDIADYITPTALLGFFMF